MELTNEFEVPVDVARAWEVLTDVERIAPCLPGAQLTEVEGDEYRGTVKIKVGPITAQYKGTARFTERDEATHRVVLEASGRDPKQGQASATVTATMAPAPGGGTAVRVVTDLTVAGKVAQFGRGVLAEVSEKLLGEFVTNLETDVLAAPAPDVPAAASPAGSSSGEASESTEGVRRIDGPEAAPVDLLDAAGTPVLKRVLGLIGGLLALLVFRRLLRGTRDLGSSS